MDVLWAVGVRFLDAKDEFLAADFVEGSVDSQPAPRRQFDSQHAGAGSNLEVCPEGIGWRRMHLGAVEFDGTRIQRTHEAGCAEKRRCPQRPVAGFRSQHHHLLLFEKRQSARNDQIGEHRAVAFGYDRLTRQALGL